MPDEHEKPRDGEFEGRTYLYIRTNPADDGTEPLPSGLKQWISPDITIIKPGGARGTEAEAGQQNQVEVVVTNAGGIEAVDAYVDVFFADPSTAFTPATATLIGGGYVTIPGYNTVTITFPWTPGTADAGHRCLVARVALYVPPDAYVNGAVFEVRADRHVAQRNINVVSVESDEDLSFSFAIVNPLPRPMQMRVRAREVRESKDLQLYRDALGCDFVQFGETPLPQVKVELGRERLAVREVGDPLELLDVTHRLSRSGILARPGLADLAALAELKKSLTLDMKPGEIVEAVVRVVRNPDTRPGDVHVVEVEQRDAERNVIGGLTLIVRH